MTEDRSKNRLQEAIDLFGQVVNSHLFAKTDVILFLNKKDLFEEKIKTVDPAEWFPDYASGCNPAKAEEYFKKRFEAQVEGVKAVYKYDLRDRLLERRRRVRRDAVLLPLAQRDGRRDVQRRDGERDGPGLGPWSAGGVVIYGRAECSHGWRLGTADPVRSCLRLHSAAFTALPRIVLRPARRSSC